VSRSSARGSTRVAQTYELILLLEVDLLLLKIDMEADKNVNGVDDREVTPSLGGLNIHDVHQDVNMIDQDELLAEASMTRPAIKQQVAQMERD
ncbi:hypothetical protein PFISCL1PPCAC_8165, partial [Pristionchus fissidentatus]